MIARVIVVSAAALLAGSCSEAAPDAAQAEAPAKVSAALSPGQYEARWTVAAVKSTDNSTPSTALKPGASGTAAGCVSEGGEIDPAIFAEGEDSCTQSSSYVRNGRISVQMSCRRAGKIGSVMQSVDGNSSADSFDAEVSTSTYLDGSGDYHLVRKLTATRVGECRAQGAAPQAAGAQ